MTTWAHARMLAQVATRGPARAARRAPPPPPPAGFTLVELLVVLGIVGLLLSILLPTIGRVREQAVRLKCGANLRQIGLSMHLYAAGERDRGFPRAPYDPKKKQLQLDDAGYLVPATFGKSGYVGDDNVPASLFLLMKNQGLPPAMFLCPATAGTPYPGDPRKSSNWKSIPEQMTYSLAAPFPAPEAVASAGGSTPVASATLAARKGKDPSTPTVFGAPLRWTVTGLGPEFAVLADINPGTRGGGDVPNNVVAPPHDAPVAQMAMANSNNHRNVGQNVLYADAHVEFRTTPYAGEFRPGAGFRDHIYTAGTGDGGVTSELAMPVDEHDSVLLPTDDPNGK